MLLFSECSEGIVGYYYETITAGLAVPPCTGCVRDRKQHRAPRLWGQWVPVVSIWNSQVERTVNVKTHTLGFPRIGIDRELKKATERFWKGNVSESELSQMAEDLRFRHWKQQTDAGIDLVPVGDFSLYDHVLDMTAMLGAVPPRYGWSGEKVDLSDYFRMARGDGDVTAMEMTKWFDTNYHYIVPEFHRGQTFSLSDERLFEQVKEAKESGFAAKPVLVGPVTYMCLGKSVDEGFDRWEHLDAVVSVYEEVLRRLSSECKWIQIDEPVLVLDLPEDIQARFAPTYERLSRAASPSKLLLATYFGPLSENVDLAASLPVSALHIDCIRGADQLNDVLEQIPETMTLSLGVVDGRNIWKAEYEKVIPLVERAAAALGNERVIVAPSCSLLHVPVDLENETKLDEEIRSWMAFAVQKCAEARTIADTVAGKDVSVVLEENCRVLESRRSSERVHDVAVQERMDGLNEQMVERITRFVGRKIIQATTLQLPDFPTTTIGSFPQTREIRAVRRKYRLGEVSLEEYAGEMRESIRDVIEKQQALGLDVLVHGEPERNDMVEYFGEQLNGFCFTENGWVQSYGTRCVKPPIIYGDVSRSEEMTVEWAEYAQSLSKKPVKGMLTGPVTILAWSFVRDDQPRSETCSQIALAIRDEVQDLEEAGISIIQIDEPALREKMPLREKDHDVYLEWAVKAFRIATSGVRDETQIHTHMCYSEFNEIIDWIAAMDADVISIEASRSRMELLEAFRRYHYPNDIGPGVYDIHSPRVPSVEEMVELLRKATEVIPSEQLWVNPDCGLKTRDWPEVMGALRNMVEAAVKMRQ